MRTGATTSSICRSVAALALAMFCAPAALAQQPAAESARRLQPLGAQVAALQPTPGVAAAPRPADTRAGASTNPERLPPVVPQAQAPGRLMGISVGTREPLSAVERASFQARANARLPASRDQDADAMEKDSVGLEPFQLQFHALEPESPNAWTLDRVERTAVDFNPLLRRSLARIDSARGNAQQAGLYPNPSFDTNNPEVFAGPQTQYNFGFQQTIVVKGKLRLERAAANEVVRQRQHALTQDRFELLLDARQQFYTVLAAQRRNQMLRQIREIAAASVRAAQARFNAGEGTLSEVLLLQTELARTEISQQTAQTILTAERRALAAIIGRPDLEIPQVAGHLTGGFPDFDDNYLREFVVSQNAQVQIARRDIERNQILLRRARVEPYPNLHGGPAYANNLATSPGSQQFWFNIQFDVPLWNRNQGNIRSAEADIADAVASLGVLQNDLLRRVEEVLGRYRAARQSEERIRTQVIPTATRAQQLVRDGYQKGILDISTFLQAQRALSDATLSYIDALENVWTTAAEIASLLQLDRFP